jgi:hypothetical protein
MDFAPGDMVCAIRDLVAADGTPVPYRAVGMVRARRGFITRYEVLFMGEMESMLSPSADTMVICRADDLSWYDPKVDPRDLFD